MALLTRNRWFSLIVVALVGAASFDLEDTDCERRHSCADPDPDFSKRNCECDDRCRSFGDCCGDSPHARPFRNDARRCMAYGASRNLGAYVIGACPPRNRSVESKCRRTDLTDPVTAAPVTTPGGATYFNAHCAQCNGADLASLVPWNPLLACESLAHHNLSAESLWSGLVRQGQDWGLHYENEFHRCTVLFDRPASVTNVRHCRADAVSTCLPGWTGDRRPCATSHEAVVYTWGLQAYRSPECALCNEVGAEDLFCDPEELVGGRVKFSFAILFDVGGEGDVVGVNNSCPDGQKFDPFNHVCRNLVCVIPGYRLVGDKCVEERG